MRSTKWWIAVLVTVGTATLGVGSASALGVKQPDVCALVTAADVQAAYGVPFEDSFSGDDANPQCGWRFGSADDIGSLGMYAEAFKSVGQAKKAYAKFLKFGHVSKPEKVKGLGQQAAYRAPGQSEKVYDGNALIVRDGKVVLRLEGGHHGELNTEVPEIANKAAMIELMRKAIREL